MYKMIFHWLFILFSVCSYSQNNSIIKIDYARFCINDSLGYIEIYYDINPLKINMSSKSDDTLISFNLNLNINKIDREESVVKKKYNFTKSINELQNGNISNFFGVLGYTLLKNNYRCYINLNDNNGLISNTSYAFDFNIKSRDNMELSVSDLQFASSITKSSNTNSLFYKNSYEVIPNIQSNYGNSNSVLYFYSELYDLNKHDKENHLLLNYHLINNKSDTLHLKSKKIPSNLPSFVLADAINISKYSSGKYDFLLTISNADKKVLASTSKKLDILNEPTDTNNISALHADVLSSEFSIYSESELDETYNFSKYLASIDEIQKWDRVITVNEKQVYLYIFWKKRENIKHEYFRRVEYANKKFRSMGKKGWKTDRGRVYCLYGKPGEIERFISSDVTKPHEMWTYYNIEGGAIFIFADLFGFSEYSLIHSTKQGELRDNDWMRKIAIN